MRTEKTEDNTADILLWDRDGAEGNGYSGKLAIVGHTPVVDPVYLDGVSVPAWSGLDTRPLHLRQSGKGYWRRTGRGWNRGDEAGLQEAGVKVPSAPIYGYAVRLFPAGRIFIQHKCRIVGFLGLSQVPHPHIFLAVDITQSRVGLKQVADKLTVNHLVCAVD